MPWCPICKNEYVEGTKMCADCKVELVEELSEQKEVPVLFGEETEMNLLSEFLKYNGIATGAVRFDESEGLYEVTVAPADKKQAKKLAVVFSREELIKKKEAPAFTNGSEPENAAKKREVSNYEKKSDKAENYRTSACTLIGVSVCGLVILVLSAFSIFPFSLGTLSYVVLGGLLLLFLMIGISSYGSYKKCLKEAEKENSLSGEIKKWCLEHLSRESFDSARQTENENESEEILYFQRMEYMKQEVTKTYLNLEEGFLDELLEEVYSEIF